jgi:beta-lactamase superfamily II metal-dependent hydrolase
VQAKRADGEYGHPQQETPDVLAGAGIEVFLTERTGDADGITMTTDCSSVQCQAPP